MAIQRGEAARDHAQAQVDQAWKTFGASPPSGNGGNPKSRSGELESLAQDREEERKELEALQEALQQPAQERDDAAKKRIRKRAGQTYLPLQEAQKELTAATEALNRLKAGIPKVMVMQERKERRNSYRLERGLYNQPRETLIAGVPASLPALEPQEDQPLNRLDLARWLTHRNHPLTARVTVNRLGNNSLASDWSRPAKILAFRERFPSTWHSWIGCPRNSWIRAGTSRNFSRPS